MEWICLLFPACISVKIINKRKAKECILKSALEIVCDWAIWVLVINVIIMSLLKYVLGIDGIQTDALHSFDFAAKYIIFSSAIAVILPYVWELITKYISVSLELEKNENI